jgi:flavin reductase (DIM6/NTAB) family NADH-FMN oxidoreductase RutF/rubredoxin
MDKSVLYDLSYGLYVIGTEANGIPTGCIVNTVFQLTSEPLTIAVSLNHNNYTTECIQNKREFTVSVLTEKTEASLIGGFGFQSGRDSYKYENVEYKQIINQLPVLTEQAAGWMSCSVDQIIDVGTHVLFVAHVLDAERISKDEPMTYDYYRNVIKGKAPANAPTYHPEDDEDTGIDSYECDICKYVYEGDVYSLPDNWVCPICGADKSHFKRKQNNS